MRAIEEGLPLIRVANTGISAAYDANGVEIARIPLEQAASIDVQLPPANPPTLYAQFGDALYGALLALTLGLSLLFRRREQPA
jgi:apolipoprotein N-acyltransferase